MDRTRRSSEKGAAQTGSKPGDPGLPGRRILLVEDDTPAAESMARLLRADGYEVRVATSGQEALEAAANELPHIVLLDLGLPDMEGHEVARRLRERKGPARPLVIAITGHGKDADRLQSYEVGIDLHLTKPVSIQELRQFLTRFQEISERSRD